jgi:hypothetical protein
MNGANKTAAILRKMTPEYKAYMDENILADSVFISATGPIPVRIMLDI